jgi:hypothetical protein
MFHVALPGSSANNDAWLERKCAVVDLFGHSLLFRSPVDGGPLHSGVAGLPSSHHL